MHQDTEGVKSIETKLEEWSSIENSQSLIETMTELFKDLRKKCTSESFRHEIASNPKVITHSLKILSKVTSIQLTSSEGPIQADSLNSSVVPVDSNETEKILPIDALNLAENQVVNKNFQVLRGDISLSEPVIELPELSDEVVSFAALVLQFLANAIVQSPQSQLNLWQHSKYFFGNLIYYPDLRLQEVIGAIIYYIFKGSPSLQGQILQNSRLMSAGIQLLRTAKTEFWYIFFEYVATNKTDFGICFSNSSPEDKITLIQLVENVIDTDATATHSESNTSDVCLSSNVIASFIQEFNKNSDLILVTTSSNRPDVNPTVVVDLLRVLCKIAAHPSHMHQVQNDKSLVINCVYLLRALHSASCDPSSSVAAVKKVEETMKERPRLETSVTYGFKADMIRMIGNLMYKNKENQDFVRENKAIEIILESTCYDGRNPFIKEWSILAIRNCCDGNEDNQKFIGDLKKAVEPTEEFDKNLSSSSEKEDSNLQNAVKFFTHMDS